MSRGRETILDRFFKNEDEATRLQEFKEGLTPIPVPDPEKQAEENEEMRILTSRVQLQKNLRHRKK